MTRKKTASLQGRTAWFSEARFGMFIHWGLYSTPAGLWKGKKIRHPYAEWLQASEHIPRQEYRKLAGKFNPEHFCADEWMQEAAGAGMKYLVVTSKHHDGFALWPTKASAFNVAEATPFKRDVIGELAAACHRNGLKLGFYYSHWLDWEGVGGDICEIHMKNAEYVHPSQKRFESYWQKKCLVQIRELVENYDPDLFWFDSWTDYTGKGRDLTGPYLTLKRQDELISLIRRLSDKCLVNSRICEAHPSPRVDYLSMPDNTFPSQGFEKPWETGGTLNDSWGYHALDFRWKSTRELIRNLVGNASLGGNYQLNVGPMGDGRFQPAALRRLREIGAWLQANGASIYGTERSPLAKMPWGRITIRREDAKRTKYYLHLWDFTPGAALFVEGLRAKPLAARVLETGQPVHASRGENGLWVSLPTELRGCDLPVIELTVN